MAVFLSYQHKHIYIYDLINHMNAKPSGLFQVQSRGSTTTNKGLQASSWKVRNAGEEQRMLLKKRLFGEHYNYARVGLNKEKKYLLQEQKNTEIERHNLILLQKIQKISRRTPLLDPIRRLNTQQDASFQQSELSARTNCMQTNRMRLKNKSLQSQEQGIKQSLSVRKSSKMTKKYAFESVLEVGKRVFEIRTYFEDDRYTIWISLGYSIQKIKMVREDYMDIYSDLLHKKHANIVNLLTFNGKLFELQKVKQFEVEIEKEVRLPTIETREVAKRKTEGNVEL